MPSRVTMVVECAVLAGLLAGCGVSRAARVGPGAGGSWAAVLAGPRVVELAIDQGPAAWMTTRNDGRLGVRSVEAVLATTEWPAPERPSLDRPVFVRVYRQPEGYIHYRTDRRREGRRDW